MPARQFPRGPKELPSEVRVYSLGYTRVLNFEETCSSGFLEKGGGYRRSIKEFAHFWSGSSLE
jgi:hypothetical protein